MKGSLKKLLTRVAKGQGGFTLIEMIVVVGIIAVLAAVIVPNIGKFIGSGETGAKNAEQGSIETAMNAMMAENAVTTVTTLAGSNSTNTWTALPAGGTSVRELYDSSDVNYQYLQAGSTVYFYCYDATGQVTRQDEVATSC